MRYPFLLPFAFGDHIAMMPSALLLGHVEPGYFRDDALLPSAAPTHYSVLHIDYPAVGYHETEMIAPAAYWRSADFPALRRTIIIADARVVSEEHSPYLGRHLKLDAAFLRGLVASSS